VWGKIKNWAYRNEILALFIIDLAVGLFLISLILLL